MSDCKETLRAFDMEEPVVCQAGGSHATHMARDPVTSAMLMWGDMPEPDEDGDTLRIVGSALDEKHEELIGDALIAFDDAAAYHDQQRHPDYEEGKHCQGERLSLIAMLCLHIHADDQDLKTVVTKTKEGRAAQKDAEDKAEGHASPYEEAP